MTGPSPPQEQEPQPALLPHEPDQVVEDPGLEPSSQTAHAVSMERMALFLNTDLVQGLTSQEAEARLAVYGPNKLKEPKPPSFLYKLWGQMNQTLIWILMIACIVSGALESWPEFGLILAVVVINVSIGLFQEGKASKATAALKSMLSSTATVIRDGGGRMEIPASEVVPGDVVFVESGNKVPADLKLFSQSNLAVQEAMLTGESMPVNKNVDKPVPLLCGLGDRKNMCYSATLCVKGQGFGVCTSTGDNTEIGRIAQLVQGVDSTKTQLMLQIDAFGRWIGMIVLPIALITFLVAFFSPIDISNDGSSDSVNGTVSESVKAQQSFVIAVAIAVSMIPAGLPAIMTICMALATSKLAKEGAIVKALPSVETLGSVMVICSDKTGTLTKNEMTVVKVRTLHALYDVTGVGYDPALGTVQGGTEDTATNHLFRNGVLNNESRIDFDVKRTPIPIGDPSECALLCLAQKAGLVDTETKAQFERVGVIPFESEHKFMATFHRQPSSQDEALVVIKGAPDRLLPKASHALDSNGGKQEVDAVFWTEQVVALSSMGYRVLALCETNVALSDVPAIVEQGPAYVSGAAQPFLTFVGLVAILDPPRESCIPAIIEAKKAGVTVKMITGDHPSTAKSIGRTLGIVDEQHSSVLTGPELDQMTPLELQKVVMEVNVFARASPDNKISIVNALKAIDKVCSMTGDGVNDAPALRAADIGVAMGITGSDVSKDAAKIILTDDNFATIIVAVKEGRRVWDNLVKILLFNMPANFAQGGIIFIAVCMQWPVIPLTAIQVLYINMITACTLGLILAVEPAEATAMSKPPRRKSKGLIGTFFYWRCLCVGAMFTTFVLGSVSWIKDYGYDAKAQHSQAFNCLIFCEIGYAFSCRFLKLSSLNKRILRGNPGAWACALLMAALNVLVTYTPGLNDFFSMSPMDGMQWGIVFLFAVASFFLVELEKALAGPMGPYTQPIIRKFKAITCCNKCRKRGDPLMEEEEEEERQQEAAVAGPAGPAASVSEVKV
ncbi:calcium-translocating P-type ATPase, PMCA-type [Batrachochytrium salamandrivorans]|nr:calcium-translocating P-type ATPase, PMCA-type [Batrachochytrium salamandrivorans]